MTDQIEISKSIKIEKIDPEIDDRRVSFTCSLDGYGKYTKEEYDSMYENINNIELEEEESDDESEEYDEVKELVNITMRLEELTEKIMSDRMLKERSKNDNEDIEDLAREIYDKYCEGVEYRSISGDSLPKGDKFFTNSSKQADSWRSVAKYILNRFY